MGAGLGFKTFVTGDVLTAADTNGYLMQGVWVFASAAARDAAVTSPQEGNFCYLKDTNATQYFTGSSWTAIGGGGGKVLQVVQATYSTATTINGGVLADTGLTASITPTLNTSKVLVMISQYLKNTSTAAATEVGAQIKLLRGATGIAGDATNLYFEYLTGASTTFDKRFVWNLHYLDSPATTSATAYKTQAKNYSASVVAQSDATMSTMILLEIGA